MSTDIQEKIAAARREAETLKEKIRAKRDQLADTTRMLTCLSLSPHYSDTGFSLGSLLLTMLTKLSLSQPPLSLQSGPWLLKSTLCLGFPSSPGEL